jgi:MFS transporter, FHS family, L-fucose permease
VANKLAGIISQFVFGGLLLAGGATAGATASLDRVITPYLILTGILVLLAGLIRFSTLPEVSEDQDEPDSTTTTAVPQQTTVFQFPNLVLGVVALFCYVGAEVIAGDTIINYGKSIGFDTDQAKYFTTYTLYSLLAGYLLGIVLIPRYVSQTTALRFGAIWGLVLTTIALLTSGFASVLAVALLGFGLAPIWPARRCSSWLFRAGPCCRSCTATSRIRFRSATPTRCCCRCSGLSCIMPCRGIKRQSGSDLRAEARSLGKIDLLELSG